MLYLSGSDRANVIGDFLKSYLPENVLKDESVAIVIGGDGFLFRMINELDDGILIIPLNGGSFGYTLNDTNNREVLVRKIANKEWAEHTFPKLEIRIRQGDNYVLRDLAANDAYIERASPQTARLKISIDGLPITHIPVICDGAIVSTAIGTTGYNLSAGGSICHPSLGVLSLTMINAHRPRIPSVLLPRNVQITIQANNQDKRPVRLLCDGRIIELENNRLTEARIKRSTENFFRIAYFDNHSLTSQLIQKIIRG